MAERRWPASEIELGKVVVEWLRLHGWQVYQQVGDVDIVAVHGPVVWVIGLKLRFCFPVIEQAYTALRNGNCRMASVAVPKGAAPCGEAALRAFG